MGEKKYQLVTVALAAEILGFHAQSVYRKIRAGIWPAYRIGGSWRIDPEEIKSLGKRGASKAVQSRQATEGGK